MGIDRNTTEKGLDERIGIVKKDDKGEVMVMYFNARSIVNKHDELELYANEENIDVIGITETWLHEAISDSEMNLEGYTLIRQDRNDKKNNVGAV